MMLKEMWPNTTKSNYNHLEFKYFFQIFKYQNPACLKNKPAIHVTCFTVTVSVAEIAQ